MSNSALTAVAEAAAVTASSSVKADEPGPIQVDADSHNRLIEQAEARGREQGAEAERQRFQEILSADGVSGNGTRMEYAMELAASAPGMSNAKIIELSCKHVSDDTVSGSGAQLADRLSDQDPLGSAAVGGSEKDAPGLDASAIYSIHNTATV